MMNIRVSAVITLLLLPIMTGGKMKEPVKEMVKIFNAIKQLLEAPKLDPPKPEEPKKRIGFHRD